MPTPSMHVQRVELPDGRSYGVTVGAGCRHDLSSVLAAVAPRARRAAVVTQPNVREALGPVVTGLPGDTFEIAVGEEEKNLSTIERLCRSFSLAGLTRNDVIVAVGGGMVTDVAGFAASVYLRGVSVVYVSTTLLGMIDAAIGGKTGVNLPEGKNLVGAFWQPSAVLCDLDALDTMPARELRSGLGEMAKYHFLEGTGPISRTPGGLDALPLDERIARCVAIKAAVVAADEREGGLRAVLNYGHTLGHAIEIASDFSVMHGEAVAIGLVYAGALAQQLGRIDAARADEHRRIVASHDLATRAPGGLDPEPLIALMQRDKKALDGLTFVLDGPNGVETVTGVDPALVRRAMSSVLD
jgi:5-deoxy-5-amino-3-dehydroquinate synthase